jgi:hypothetical protein
MDLHIGNYLVELHAFAFIPVLLCAAVAVTSIIATVRIIQRAGFSGWWTLITLVPGLNLLALWYFGFGPWPAVDSKAASSN